MKERVTLTIEGDILKQVDSKIDKEKIKNRSHAIELLLRKALRGTVPNTAVIIAGGKGADLGGLTKNIPQQLVELNGQPIMAYNVELLKRFGVERIIIHVAFMADKIKKYFGNGERFGVKIEYNEAPEPVGTAGFLKSLNLAEPFIMLNADEVKDVDLVKLYESHNQNKATVTIGLTTVNDPSEYGVAMLDGNRILRFIEKPEKDSAPSMLISGGIFVVEPEILNYIPEGFASLEQDVFPKLAREGKLYGYPFSGQWFPTDTIERLKIAKATWKGFRR